MSDEIILYNIKFFPETKFKQTEIGLIPEDWQVVRLGEVADISSGGSAPQGSQYFGGNNYFIRVQHIDNENYLIKGYDLITDEAIKKYKLKLFKKGTIVFPKSGATVYLEKRAILPFDSYIVSHLCAVISKTPNLFQNYLFYVLIKTKFAEKKGDGYPTLNISEVKNFLIPLPPLPEQRAIAEVLSTIQEAKEKTEAVIKATRELKKSMMKHLFTYGPVPLSEVDKVKLKETEIGPIPEDWQVVRLEEMADFKNGINFNASEKGKKGVLTIDVLNMYGEELSINTRDLYRVNKVIDESYILKDNDILFVRSSLKQEGVGWASLFKSINEKVTFCGFLIRARLKVNEFNPEFLVYYLRTDFARNRLVASSGKVAITNINQGMLGNLLIPLPPLPIQKKIAEILKAIDDKIEKEEAKKKALENLFKSMLHNLMTGKLRVKINED